MDKTIGVLVGSIAFLVFFSCDSKISNNKQLQKQIKEYQNPNIQMQEWYRSGAQKYINQQPWVAMCYDSESREKLIDSLQLHRICRDARWRVYWLLSSTKWYYQDSVIRKYRTEKTVKMHTLDIRLEGIIYNSNKKGQRTYTPIFQFFNNNINRYGPLYFYIVPDKFETSDSLTGIIDNRIELVYLTSQDKPVEWRFPNREYYPVDYNGTYHFPDKQMRAINQKIAFPLQKDVINIIKEHAAELDPWIYNEAVRRGVIDSVQYPRRAK